jgi:hypothetical protein
MLTLPVRNGITSTHVAFIKRGHVIILCFAVRPGQQIPLELADVVFAVSDNKPCIIVVCSSPADMQETIPSPTVIQTIGYTPPALEAMAELIFGEQVLRGFQGGIQCAGRSRCIQGETQHLDYRVLQRQLRSQLEDWTYN